MALAGAREIAACPETVKQVAIARMQDQVCGLERSLAMYSQSDVLIMPCGVWRGVVPKLRLFCLETMHVLPKLDISMVTVLVPVMF